MTTLEQSIRHVRQVLTDTPGATTASFERAAVRDLLLKHTAEAREPGTIETLSRDTLVTPTLRDQFAMHAMGALASGGTCYDATTSREYIAETSYGLADAMLAARGTK